MDNAAIGMCLISPDGRFEDINPALCQLFGYDAPTLREKTFQETDRAGLPRSRFDEVQRGARGASGTPTEFSSSTSTPTAIGYGVTFR